MVLFEFLAMLTASVVETKQGKYEDNMRKQIGVERLFKIIDHLNFPIKVPVNWRNAKIVMMLD